MSRNNYYKLTIQSSVDTSIRLKFDSDTVRCLDTSISMLAPLTGLLSHVSPAKVVVVVVVVVTRVTRRQVEVGPLHGGQVGVGVGVGVTRLPTPHAPPRQLARVGV